MTERFLVLNGPNLNLLGTREPETYGSTTLTQIIEELTDLGTQHDFEIRHVQSNSEGILIDALHDARTWADGVLFNAAGYTHTSVALRDAVVACQLPVIEVHLSNVHSREEFRHKSLLSAVCVGVVCGFGADSYSTALHGLRRHIAKPAN